MNLLVLVQDYPDSSGKGKLMYVHVRNKYYKEHGLGVTVLNFSAKSDYTVDGIQVISLASYKENKESYDILVCHAANLKSHYRFIKRYGNRFLQYVFFFHGHEVLSVIKEYPQEYDYTGKKNALYRLGRDSYDNLKFYLWRQFYLKNKDKIHFVFVSNWLKDKFFFYLELDEKEWIKRYSVINNSVGKVFETSNYTPETKLQYDFITIRSPIDRAAYCINLLTSIAFANPDKKFLIIGRGDYYKYNVKPDNITLISRLMPQEELIGYINKARYALMLTSFDTQGVMSCELATYGIPLITSNIPVCHEIFDPYESVTFLDNGNIVTSFKETVLMPSNVNKKLYSADKTILKEILLYEEILKQGRPF